MWKPLKRFNVHFLALLNQMLHLNTVMHTETDQIQIEKGLKWMDLPIRCARYLLSHPIILSRSVLILSPNIQLIHEVAHHVLSSSCTCVCKRESSAVLKFYASLVSSAAVSNNAVGVDVLKELPNIPDSFARPVITERTTWRCEWRTWTLAHTLPGRVLEFAGTLRFAVCSPLFGLIPWLSRPHSLFLFFSHSL